MTRKDYEPEPLVFGCVFSRVAKMKDCVIKECERCPFGKCINNVETQEELAHAILDGQDVEDAIVSILKDKGIKQERR